MYNTKLTKWGFSPELNQKIDEFFNARMSDTLTLPISFFPTEGIATWTSEGKQHVETELPGVSKENLSVTYNDYDGYLTIEGKATVRGKVKEIKKVIYVGEGLDDKLMTATLEDGILNVSFPDSEKTTKKATGTKIKIN